VTAADGDVVDVEVADRVTTITLQRPSARNALNTQLMGALWDAVVVAGADSEVDVVILTGADPAFCAGVDLKEAAGEVDPAVSVRWEPGEGPGRDVNGLYRFLPSIDKPIIGAINGPAITGGLELALQCTFLVASERAWFGDTHARVGVMPGGGLTVLLARAVGLPRAIELSLTGNFLSAADARQHGLVNHVVAHDELLPFARRLAADVVGNDPVGVRRLLAHYKQIANAATLDEAHLIEGVMAETWAQGVSSTGARRAAVTSRGRAQAGSTSTS
jgi:enoyl-CoA hydratase